MASASLAPFRSRDFTLIWIGALVSNVGTWMETVALGYYVADTTGQPSWSAIVAAASFIPGAIVGPVGSAMADRLRRRRVLLISNSVSAVIAAVVAVWVGSGHATAPGLAVLGFIGGTVFAFGFPSFQTSLPELVPREHLVAAVGLSNAQWNLGRILGPALAAVTIAVGGIGFALWCNAISFLAVIASIATVSISSVRGERRPIFAALGDGVRFARTTPVMRRMLTVMVAVIFLGSPFIAFVPQIATNVFDGDSTATSILVMSQGVGAVAAAFTLGSVSRRFGSSHVMLTAAAALSVTLCLYGAAPVLALAAVGLALVGLSYGFAFTTMAGIAQEVAPDAMRGRVLAVNSFVLGILYPVGTLVQGAIADVTSLRTVTIGSGVALAVALFVLRVTGRVPSIGRPLRSDSPAASASVMVE
ncbi:MAG: MFS transporter [Ilumatobacteraceae bacterium]